MHRLYEFNSQGPIPYVPYLRAPWYIWIGRKKTTAELMGVEVEEKVEAPPLFPPTFLYSQSWEDPAPDMEVLNINDKDVCLTLTSGGCNTLNLALHGAKVVSVDCNPAQTALLELKMVAIKQLPYELVWKMFGEGVLPEIDEVYHKRLAPWMSETSRNFWDSRLRYFKQGLYYQGGMGALVYFWSWMQARGQRAAGRCGSTRSAAALSHDSLDRSRSRHTLPPAPARRCCCSARAVCRSWCRRPRSRTSAGSGTATGSSACW